MPRPDEEERVLLSLMLIESTDVDQQQNQQNAGDRMLPRHANGEFHKPDCDSAMSLAFVADER